MRAREAVSPGEKKSLKWQEGGVLWKGLGRENRADGEWLGQGDKGLEMSGDVKEIT